MLPPDNPGTDPVDPLKLLQDQPIPPADATRRATTLLQANLAFREKISARAQEKGWWKRLFDRSTSVQEPVMFKSRYTFAKGTAIAVVALVALSTTYDYLNPYLLPRSSAPVRSSVSPTASNVAPAPAPAPAESALTSLSVKSAINGVANSLTQSAESDATAGSASYARVECLGDGPCISRDSPPPPASAPVALAEGSSAVERRAGRSVVIGDDVQIGGVTPPILPGEPMPLPLQGRDKFSNLADAPMQEVAQMPVSTFSADTDTASYSVVRRMLQAGQMPPADAVRVEEFLNYFHYSYPVPDDRARPFAPVVSVYPNPWNPQSQLMRIGIKAYDLPGGTRPPVNLVLLVDVSGSMSSADKLELAKKSFAMMLEKLQPSDSVAIVTYAGNSGVTLPPTPVENKDQILAAISNLGAGGSTNGIGGLQTAYELARQNFHKEGVNRILLATDGDFNVGISSPGGVAEYVAQQRSSGIFLSVLGFGMGNYQDTTMQAIAQNGNGVAAYIDSLSEARRVLGDEITSTMFTVAKDVKFQVEFNPVAVRSYRLVGYETRALQREDFDNDKVDAGEVGAGHAVTAIYEIWPARAVSATNTYRYVPASPLSAPAERLPNPSGEIAFLRIRYKLPDASESSLIERPVTTQDEVSDIAQAPADARFATAVAGFAKLLRHSEGMLNFGYGQVLSLAEGAAADEDKSGERRNFLELVRNAQALKPSAPLTKEEGGVAFPPPQ